jgi:Tfp pilus assembly protein PilV
MKIKHTQEHTKGFTLIELLIYIAGLLVLGSILSMLVVQFYSIYKEIVAIPRADRTGLLLVDRITKEIRSAEQVDILESQFGTTTGVLDLDSVTDNVTTEKKFYVENGIAKYQEDSDTPINLSSKDFIVSNFNFTFVQTSVSDAVRFDLELQFQTKNATETKSYTGFAILRESYE